jgi:hypothetical protein
MSIRSSRLKKIANIIDGPFALVSDIEGAEAGMFIEEDTSLDECKQIIIEVHDTIYNDKKLGRKEVVEKIKSNGFEVTDEYGPVFCFENKKTVK